MVTNFLCVFLLFTMPCAEWKQTVLSHEGRLVHYFLSFLAVEVPTSEVATA